jgi:hypothetical protein
MFKFIQKLLNTDHPKNESPPVKQDFNKHAPCSLELEMNKDGTINIICSWPKFTEDNKKYLINLANHYALMIEALNAGFLEKEIVNTVKNYSSDNYMDTLFAQNVYYKLIELNFLRTEQEKINNPLIKPSQVFNRSV